MFCSPLDPSNPPDRQAPQENQPAREAEMSPPEPPPPSGQRKDLAGSDAGEVGLPEGAGEMDLTLPPCQAASSSEPALPPDAVSDAQLRPEELAEAQHYGRLQRKCLLADRAIDLLYWAVASLVLARPMEHALASAPLFRTSDTLRLLGLFLGIFLVHALVSLPLSFYAGYVLEHRFGLSRLTVLRWAWRYGKQLLLALVLTGLMVVGLFWIIRLTGVWWWVAGAGAFFLLSVVLGQLAPVLILPLFYRVEPLDRPELLDRLRRLADGTGLTLEGIYRLDLSVETVKANAALAGLGRTRRVLLGDTLLEHFTPEEIETIFAHEVGHHVHRHIGKMLLMGLVGSAAGFLLCDHVLTWWVGLGAVSDGLTGFSYRDFPVWAMPMVLFLLAVLGTLMEPILNAISRWHEQQADQYALKRTGNPEAFLRAFRRLARLNKEDPDPPAWEVLLFHSHPPIRHRLALAEQFAPQQTSTSSSGE